MADCSRKCEYQNIKAAFILKEDKNCAKTSDNKEYIYIYIYIYELQKSLIALNNSSEK